MPIFIWKTRPGLCDYIEKNEDLPSVSTQEYIKVIYLFLILIKCFNKVIVTNGMGATSNHNPECSEI